MANTNALKKEIEPALLHRFWEERHVTPVSASSDMTKHLLGMSFDGIGIDRSKEALVFCEATVSGYHGARGKDFHTGATRKFADSFARFSIVHHQPIRDQLLKDASHEFRGRFTTVMCYLIVPRNSRFLNALGYRSQWLKMGVMELFEVELSQKARRTLDAVLYEARDEMTRRP